MTDQNFLEMENLNIAVIFYSATGANYQMAQWAEASAKESGAQVKLLKIKENTPQEAIDENPAWKANVSAMQDIPEVSLDDLEWADGIIFTCPTRYGTIPAQLKAFIDTTGGLWSKGKLADKVVTAMSSAANVHGGQEATILSLYTQMMHWGCIIAAPGYTDKATFDSGGNPYGTSATVDQQGKIKDDIEAGVRFQAKRLVTITGNLKKGKA